MSHLFFTLRDMLPVSHLFLALYGETARENQDMPAGDLVRLIYAEVYQVDLEEDQVLQICERLETHGARLREMVTKLENRTAEKKAKPAERGRGDFFEEWLEGLDMTQTMLWLADFNLAEARRLYSLEDYELVERMVVTKKRMTQEQGRLDYESTLFGFGGKYGKSTGGGRDLGEVRTHDLSNLSSEQALARLAQMSRRG